MSCAHVHFSIHVNTCVDWKLIGRCVGLTEADLTTIDGDNRTVEEKSRDDGEMEGKVFL